MPATYKDFDREPSKPHQCMHHSDKDGTRCRASSMHNEYMCYHHRSDDIPTVIQNDPFLIERLNDQASIQKALADVAARLACNHIDLKRAGLLLQAIQIAATALRTSPPAAAANPTPGEGVISTEGDASVAAVERPPHLARPAVPPTPRPQSTPPPRLHGWKVPKAPPAPPVSPQPATSHHQPATNDRLPRHQRNRRRHHSLTTCHLPLTTRPKAPACGCSPRPSARPATPSHASAHASPS